MLRRYACPLFLRELGGLAAGVLRRLVRFRTLQGWQGVQVIMSTENLYNRVKANSKTSHPEETNPLLQLDAIGNFVADCSHILKQWKKQQAAA